MTASITRTGVAVLVTSAVLTGACVLFASAALAVPAAAGLCLLLTGVLVTALPYRRPKDIIIRVHPSSVARGEPVTVVVGLEPRTRRPALTRFLLGHGPYGRELIEFSPGPSGTWRASVPTSRRGLLQVGPVIMRRESPLGLFHRDTEMAPAQAVQVRPAVVPVRIPSVWRSPHADSEGTRRGSPGGQEFHSLRTYQIPDDIRHIHWLSSARVGTPLIKIAPRPAAPALYVFLDRQAACYPDPDDFETAVDLATSLFVAALGTGVSCIRVRAGADRTGTDRRFHTTLQVMAEMSEIGLRAGAGAPAENWPHGVRTGDGSGLLTVVTGNGGHLSPTLLATLSRRFTAIVVLRVGNAGPRGAIRQRFPKRVRVLHCVSATHGAAAWSAQARLAGRRVPR